MYIRATRNIGSDVAEDDRFDNAPSQRDVYRYDSCSKQLAVTTVRFLQGGSKSEILLVFEFPMLSDELCLQFVLTCISFSL